MIAFLISGTGQNLRFTWLCFMSQGLTTIPKVYLGKKISERNLSNNIEISSVEYGYISKQFASNGKKVKLFTT